MTIQPAFLYGTSSILCRKSAIAAQNERGHGRSEDSRQPQTESDCEHRKQPGPDCQFQRCHHYDDKTQRMQKRMLPKQVFTARDIETGYVAR